MAHRWSMRWIGLALAATCWFLVAGGDLRWGATPAGAQAPLISDQDFEQSTTSAQLRKRAGTHDWYESRYDTKAGRKLLLLSQKKIGGNATRKAMIKASPQFNTYLSQGLTEPQTGRFSLQYDIYVKEILAPYNRSCFQMIGNDKVRKRGPNATGAERFVFLAFQAAEAPGQMNLVAFEGGDAVEWSVPTTVANGLQLKKWYTVRVDVDVAAKAYQVSVAGVTPQPVRIKAFKPKGKPTPEVLTHISFASWNDGPGTFYIDNVRQP
jgi:hypothetical protein